VYRSCGDLEDIFCVYAGNCTAVHICLYNDLVLILDADELQLLLTVESTLVSIPTVFFKQLFRMIDRRAKVGRFAINLDYNKIMGST
jgi:hypothetical protein